jgi:hypothetical protein
MEMSAMTSSSHADNDEQEHELAPGADAGADAVGLCTLESS